MLAHNKLWRLVAMWLFATAGMAFAQAQTRHSEAFGKQNNAPEVSAKTAAGEEEEAASRSLAHASSQDNPREEYQQTRQHQVFVLMDFIVNTFGLLTTLEGVGSPFTWSIRYHLPLPTTRHWFALEMGTDILLLFYDDKYHVSTLIMSIPIEFFWGFRRTPSFALYWKVGVGAFFAINRDKEFYILPFPAPTLHLGLMWDFSKLLHLRLEMGFPGLLHLGLGFGF